MLRSEHSATETSPIDCSRWNKILLSNSSEAVIIDDCFFKEHCLYNWPTFCFIMPWVLALRTLIERLSVPSVIPLPLRKGVGLSGSSSACEAARAILIGEMNSESAYSWLLFSLKELFLGKRLWGCYTWVSSSRCAGLRRTRYCGFPSLTRLIILALNFRC